MIVWITVLLHFMGEGTFEVRMPNPVYESMQECSEFAEKSMDALQSMYKADGITISCNLRGVET